MVLVLFYVGTDVGLWYSWWERVWLAFSNIWVAGGGFVGFCFGEWSFCLQKDNSLGEHIGWCVRSGISSPSEGGVTSLSVLLG